MSRHIRTLLQITCGFYPSASITIELKKADGTRKRGLVELAGIEPATS